jgi:hypothetical protein
MARQSSLTPLKLISIYRKRIEQGVEGPRLTPPLEAAAPPVVEIIEMAAPPVRAAQPPEPIKENLSMSETVELTDDLLRETYYEIYIGQSESLAACAQILDIKPDELRRRWETDLGLKMRTKPQAMAASKQKGTLYVFPPTEANPDPVAQSSESMAEDLGLAIPDGKNPAYTNGSLQPAAPSVVEKPKKPRRPQPAKEVAAAPVVDPTPPPAATPSKEGPGRRASDPLETPLKEGETVAFKIKNGEVLDVQRRPALTATGLAAFAAALDHYTISRVLDDIKAEADPEVNQIRHYLAAEYKKSTRGGK